jgi:hypothetical protein
LEGIGYGLVTWGEEGKRKRRWQTHMKMFTIAEMEATKTSVVVPIAA